MPTPIEEDTTLSIEDLQEALKREHFGAPPEDQDVLEPGEDETIVEPGPAEEPVAAEKPQEPIEEPVEEPVEEPQQKVLTEEELANFVVKAKVNGKEVEYTWKDLRDIKQTQDAAQEFLERAKKEFKEERDAYRQEHATPRMTATEAAQEEYLTDEEKRVRALEGKYNELAEHQRQIELDNLNEAEELHMREAFQRDGFSVEEAFKRIKTIVDTDEDAAEFVRELFTEMPEDRADLEKRKKTFNVIWKQTKALEMPEVVRRVAELAKDEGKTEAKIEAKRELAETPAGHTEMRGPSRRETLEKLAKADDSGLAKFFLDNSVVLKSYD